MIDSGGGCRVQTVWGQFSTTHFCSLGARPSPSEWRGDGKSTKKRLHQAQAEKWAATKQLPWKRILQGLVLLGWENGGFVKKSSRNIWNILKNFSHELKIRILNKFNKRITYAKQHTYLEHRLVLMLFRPFNYKFLNVIYVLLQIFKHLFKNRIKKQAKKNLKKQNCVVSIFLEISNYFLLHNEC